MDQSKKPSIVVGGNGKMADAMLRACATNGLVHGRFDTQWMNDTKRERPINNTVGIYFGSNARLPRFLAFCAKHKIPVIVGSTDVQIPKVPGIVIVNAPNLSMPMLDLMGMLPAIVEKLGKWSAKDIRIVESHRAKKKDTSGTALMIARMCHLPQSSIRSIRDPAVQLALGVPEANLNDHAYHDVIFSGMGVTIKIQVRIDNRNTYTAGAIVVASALLRNKRMEPEIGMDGPLPPGIYELSDPKVYAALVDFVQ